MAMIRPEAEAEEHAKFTTEHRLAKEQLKVLAANRILVGQMKNRLGFVEKQKKVEEAFHGDYIYVPESFETPSFYTDSNKQGSSPAPLAPAVAAAHSDSVTGAAPTVVVLSDDE